MTDFDCFFCIILIESVNIDSEIDLNTNNIIENFDQNDETESEIEFKDINNMNDFLKNQNNIHQVNGLKEFSDFVKHGLDFSIIDESNVMTNQNKSFSNQSKALNEAKSINISKIEANTNQNQLKIVEKQIQKEFQIENKKEKELKQILYNEMIQIEQSFANQNVTICTFIYSFIHLFTICLI